MSVKVVCIRKIPEYNNHAVLKINTSVLSVPGTLFQIEDNYEFMYVYVLETFPLL